MLDKLNAILMADAGIVAACGGRICYGGAAADNVELPALIVTVTDERRHATQAGTSKKYAVYSVEVSALGGRYTDASNLAVVAFNLLCDYSDDFFSHIEFESRYDAPKEDPATPVFGVVSNYLITCKA